jgi:hypothetical protein
MGVARQFQTAPSRRSYHIGQFPDGRQSGNYPETGFEEIGVTESLFLEADFWLASFMG